MQVASSRHAIVNDNSPHRQHSPNQSAAFANMSLMLDIFLAERGKAGHFTGLRAQTENLNGNPPLPCLQQPFMNFQAQQEPLRIPAHQAAILSERQQDFAHIGSFAKDKQT